MTKGLTKKQILDSPQGKMLYEQYMKKMSGKGKMKGMGWSDFVNWLKDTKIISKVGSVLLPAAGGALAGLLTANPLGLASGAAVGEAGAEWIKSQGFGKRRSCGGTSVLVISPPGQRLGQKGKMMKGKGLTISYNGTYQNTRQPQLGAGGSAFGSVSSEFGQIKI